MFSRLCKKKLDTESIMSEEEICKICLESHPSSRLIHPCKCQGSIRSVHEKCLIAWLRMKDPELFLARCELCKHRYNIEYSLGLVCNLKPKNCSYQYLSLLFKLTLSLSFLVFTFYLNLMYPENGTNYCLFMIVTNTIFVLLILLMFGIFMIVFCKPFLKLKPKNWKILDYVPPNSKPRRPELRIEASDVLRVDQVEQTDHFNPSIAEQHGEVYKDVYFSSSLDFQDPSDCTVVESIVHIGNTH